MTGAPPEDVRVGEELTVVSPAAADMPPWRRRRIVLGAAAVVGTAALAGAAALALAHDDGGDRLRSANDFPATLSATATAAPSPAAVPSPEPTPSAPVVTTALPAAVVLPSNAAAAISAVAPATPSTSIIAPAPPAKTRPRIFQGLYGPLPSGCAPGYGCAYADAVGPVPGGLQDLVVRAQDHRTISVRWTDGAPWRPPAVGFVLFAYDRGDGHGDDGRGLLLERRFEMDVTSTVLSDVPSGRKIEVLVHTLNSEGLSNAHSRDDYTPFAPVPPEPSPTATPTAG